MLASEVDATNAISTPPRDLHDQRTGSSRMTRDRVSRTGPCAGQARVELEQRRHLVGHGFVGW